MTYSVRIVSATREGARLQIEDYFHENLKHFPKQVVAFDAIMALFDTLPQNVNALGYEVEITGGQEIAVRLRPILPTYRPLQPTRLTDEYLKSIRAVDSQAKNR